MLLSQSLCVKAASATRWQACKSGKRRRRGLKPFHDVARQAHEAFALLQTLYGFTAWLVRLASVFLPKSASTRPKPRSLRAVRVEGCDEAHVALALARDVYLPTNQSERDSECGSKLIVDRRAVHVQRGNLADTRILARTCANTALHLLRHLETLFPHARLLHGPLLSLR